MPMNYIKTTTLPRTDNPILNKAFEAIDEEFDKIARVFIDWTDASQNFKTSGTIEGSTVKLTDLTDGYVPYHIDDATGLADSPIFTDGTNIGIATTTIPGTLSLKNQAQLQWVVHASQVDSRSWAFGQDDGAWGNFVLNRSNARDNTIDTRVLTIDKDGNFDFQAGNLSTTGFMRAGFLGVNIDANIPLHLNRDSVGAVVARTESNSKTAGNEISHYQMAALDSNDNYTVYANMVGIIADPTDGAEIGQLNFEIHGGGIAVTFKGPNVGIANTNPQEKLAVAGNLALPKASGNGIKIDNTTPTFGWRDLLGDVFARNTGASKPSFTTYRDSLLEFQFATGDEEYFKFHIPHDYVAGTDIHLHIHWSHTSAAVTGGTVTFEYEISYAKGHSQAVFGASVGTTFNGTAATGAGGQYKHVITEVQISAGTPNGNQIDSDDLEPDGVIIARLDLNANNMTGATPDPFIHFVDIHYQSTNIGTKDKVPDFYA